MNNLKSMYNSWESFYQDVKGLKIVEQNATGANLRPKLILYYIENQFLYGYDIEADSVSRLV